MISHSGKVACKSFCAPAVLGTTYTLTGKKFFADGPFVSPGNIHPNLGCHCGCDHCAQETWLHVGGADDNSNLNFLDVCRIRSFLQLNLGSGTIVSYCD
jgi:hypothetical protein